MSDLLAKRLLKDGYDVYAAAREEYRKKIAEQADEIERLEAENASLASWQCEFTDGKTGLVYGEGGSTYCAMAKRMQQLEAEAKTRTLDYLGQVGQLSEELERVKREAERAQDAHGVRFLNYLEETARLTDEINRLRAALRPFAWYAENLVPQIDKICGEGFYKSLEEARAALEGE